MFAVICNVRSTGIRFMQFLNMLNGFEANVKAADFFRIVVYFYSIRQPIAFYKSNPSALNSCHILFLSKTYPSQFKKKREEKHKQHYSILYTIIIGG